MTNYHYWQYFLSLEADLITTSRYIEFSSHVNENGNIENNAKTFSPELLRILFAACAECENILKVLTRSQSNIEGLKNAIMNSPYSTLSNRSIFCPAYDLDFTPWEAWNRADSSPQWWGDHNKLKHERTIANHSHYHKANLYNTLNSVAALMCLLYEYYKEELDGNEGKYSVSLPPGLAPKLFIPKNSGLGYANSYWVWQIPNPEPTVEEGTS